ncbi:MAG: acyltransferase [Gemmatimonadaceae bacterium]
MSSPTTTYDAIPASQRGHDAARRIPSLDGLRGISILVVLLGHLAGTAGFPATATALVLNRYVDVANLGVRVFFVISGFLITGLLVDEFHSRGSISLSRFYLRRTLRIFPAYYAFIAVVSVLSLAGVLGVTRGDIAHALTYTVNYSPDRSWAIGHLWSLAVEEQFYLLWPALVLMLGLMRARRAAIAVMLAVPIIRVIEFTFVPQIRPIVGTSFETMADALAVGCLLALMAAALQERRWYRWMIESRWAIPMLFVIGVVASLRVRPAFLIGLPLTHIAIALAVARCVAKPTGVVGAALNRPWLVYIGTLSYSIYLWQQLFLDRASSALTSRFPLNIIMVAVCALPSYYLVERPLLRWRPAIERKLLGDRPRRPAAP